MAGHRKKPETPEAGGAKPVRLRPRRPCPICGQPSAQGYHPFCSARCADIDLHRWLGGRYRIETDEPAGPEEDER
ncbi:DNA gyrase inhibitor YacG [Kaustia mangrovi]|uniref:DNA gyrase inhibitor YacG n=1 Tax=Kaustia mangrovi TaxID=2593653 RepID=A0A7S8C362_9HYPH|nr:DNA gyrase inhibitor YacG [Kaustia mangrovi]QPC42535.1 DNA gyrase inhibitor YacG [Kaustia mangrovi]